MLKADRQALMDLVSGVDQSVATAVQHLETLEGGHFEDHPASKQLVREHAPALVRLCASNSPQAAKRWAAQFLADAGVLAPGVKEVVLANARDADCRFLPTLLYLVGSNPTEFEDAGEVLELLAQHSDVQVRWRVAWAISRMKRRDESMQRALMRLRTDSHQITQVYVRAVEG